MTSITKNYLQILHQEVPAFENVPTRFNYKPKTYLTPLSISGLTDVHEYSSVPEFFEYIDVDCSTTITQTKEYMEKLIARIANGYKSGYAMYWHLHLRQNNKIIGTFCLVGVDFDKKIAEIGKGLSTFHLGKGYMFEAQWVVLKYAFYKLGLKSVFSYTHADNKPNIYLMEAAGFRIIDQEINTYRDGVKHPYLRLEVNRNSLSLDRCLALAKIAH